MGRSGSKEVVLVITRACSIGPLGSDESNRAEKLLGVKASNLPGSSSQYKIDLEKDIRFGPFKKDSSEIMRAKLLVPKGHWKVVPHTNGQKAEEASSRGGGTSRKSSKPRTVV